MKKNSLKCPTECTILIVDDEVVIVEMLRSALAPAYTVVTATSGTEALACIDRFDFDVVITDLKMQDVPGLEVLEYAKSKDEFTEVIVMTGYPTLDSATLAINQGVYSYLLKPLQIEEFLIQVGKAVASRLFHLRSIELMRQSDELPPDVKTHVHEITSLYYFVRKLMLSLEISEIMRIALDEANKRMDSSVAVISIAHPGCEELFMMPSHGEMSESEGLSLLSRFRDRPTSSAGNGRKMDAGPLPVMYKGRQGTPPDLHDVIPVSVPMMVTDRVLGTLTVFVPQSASPPKQTPFLYVFSSIVSSVIDHGYAALQARKQAKTDSLTGIANHRHFHETLDREISRSNRRKSPFALVLMDIDNFKRINDIFGHQVGDAVLVDMTRRVSAMIRAGDVLARYGGEEFGLILPDTGESGAMILADRILVAIASRPFTFTQREISYTVSIGLSVYSGESVAGKDRLIAAADRALYDSKENGKNRLTIGKVFS